MSASDHTQLRNIAATHYGDGTPLESDYPIGMGGLEVQHVVAAVAAIDALVRTSGDVADRIERQIPVTRAYLVQNGIDGHFADVLLSHYGDLARDLRQALSQASGEAA